MKRAPLLLTLLLCTQLHAQLVYVDKSGILRWTKTQQEAAFFGVNYTVPFAYSYRAHKALGIDPEAAIRADVYHMARLGLDAFRVHVWDTEITDSLGNLLENEHLRLFDFLIAELEKRHIMTIMTPIAFWGNGYPERDERTPGFSRVYGKSKATANDTAIRAQENYLKQLFRHVNPYTHHTYTDDENIIAVELNNEPSHSGPKSGVTAYIDRLAAAIRSVGWTKPLFYNISQSPYYADAVAKAAVDGHSFQWYPTGLVSGAELTGNFLPNVDTYRVPFDTIPEFRNKARMVYEFETADVLKSYMYPAVARSFRTAGFQWATQFAYDPMALAYANTEYQTHYCSLPYTPGKAISLLIASEVFHTVPRGKSYGAYPADTVFDAFHVSYREDLSEMNTAKKFYYTNNTSTQPIAPKTLEHIAGVGSSPIIHYTGSGAYFLDRISPGEWSLEVMPDIIRLRDPFGPPSPDREAIRVQWDENAISVDLPGLDRDFDVYKFVDAGIMRTTGASDGTINIRPGAYVLIRHGAPLQDLTAESGEFYAPQPHDTSLFLRHDPYQTITAGNPFTIDADVAGLDTGHAYLVIGRLGGRQPSWIPMERRSATHYTATVPASLVTPGALTYRIILQKGNAYAAFPGDVPGNPFAWQYHHDEAWTTYVAAPGARLTLFDPTTDHNAWVYPGFARGFQTAYITGEIPEHLVLQFAGTHTMGLQYDFLKKTTGRLPDLSTLDQLVIRARGTGRAHVVLTDGDGFSYGTDITLGSDMQDLVPQNWQPDSCWLMPRPYPGFQPLWFKAAGSFPPFSLSNMEKVQISTEGGNLEIASIWLEKK